MRDVTRREALRRIAVGGAAAAAAPLWVEALVEAAAQHAAHHQQSASAAGAWSPKVLTAEQNRAVIALAERIIPRTDTPGATDAKVNEFIDSVLAEAAPTDRQKFLDGLAWVDARSRRDHGAPFADATEAQQIALLTAMSSKEPAAADDQTGRDFFTAIKSMTVTGFYTSEIGLRDEIGDPGTLFFTEFKGCTHPEHQG